MTYQELYQEGYALLRAQGIEDARTDAHLLLEYACGMTGTDYLLRMREQVPAQQERAYREALRSRAQHIPLQHITGEQMFMGFAFRVNEHVLIPRQETELLVQEALRVLAEADNAAAGVLDLCTGSGCIAVSIALLARDVAVTGTDLSAQALETAKQNAERLGATVSLIRGDLFEGVRAQSPLPSFDLIVSNPPYIETDVIETLQPEVRLHDPHMALDGGADGLVFYRRIAAEAKDFLRSGGTLLLEIGAEQAGDVCHLLKVQGWTRIRVLQDLSGRDRVVGALR